MTKKVLVGLALTALALVASSYMLAWSEDEPVELQSVITGCGVTADADCCKSDCIIACGQEKMECVSTCGPLPEDCNDTPIGPDCEEWGACRQYCMDEWAFCRRTCSFCKMC